MRPGLIWLPALCLGLLAGPAWGQGTKNDPKEEAALMDNAKAFVESFHKGDAKALAAHWTPDGDYTDQKGKHLKGRAAIEQMFADFFAGDKDLKLRIDIHALRFVTPEVAIEDGVTTVLTPDGAPPSRARYTIVHVKKDGKWRLSSVRDSTYAPPNNHEHLSELEWIIGNWAAESGKSAETAQASFAWADQQNFIVSSFTTTFKDIAIGGATQWIGYDAAAKQIRSWTFENNGGFGEGKWAREGDRWEIKTAAVLRDGKQVTATNVLTRLDADTFTWQARDITVDGKAMPAVKEVKMKRVK
jgi:uncharacterized protein (TIGR02246 family)